MKLEGTPVEICVEIGLVQVYKLLGSYGQFGVVSWAGAAAHAEVTVGLTSGLYKISVAG